jgi:hypothetical protein
MIIQYKIPSRRGGALPAFSAEPSNESVGRPPRLARLVALAHKLEALTRSGEVKDYVELARLAQVSPARIAQIVILAQLAPEIQEYLLFLSAEHAGLIGELQLRDVARELHWDRQRARFEKLLRRVSVARPRINRAGLAFNDVDPLAIAREGADA